MRGAFIDGWASTQSGQVQSVMSADTAMARAFAVFRLRSRSRTELGWQYFAWRASIGAG